MKISAKAKIVTIGVSAVLILGLISIFLFLNETTSQYVNLSARNPGNPISSENTDQNKKELNASPKDIAEAIAFLDKLDKNNEYDKNSKTDGSLPGIAVDIIKTDKSAVKDEKANMPKRTPEQQRKYEILEQYLPRFFELHDWFIEVDQAENTKPPEGLTGDELGRWLLKRDTENEKKYSGSLKRQRYAEQIKVHETLIDNFPGLINGETFINPGWGAYRLIREVKFKELRELVGGNLPTDKAKYAQIGNDWVPAE